MTEYRGKFTVTTDSEQRFTIPAPFHRMLEQVKGPALAYYTVEHIDGMYALRVRHAPFSDTAFHLQRSVKKKKTHKMRIKRKDGAARQYLTGELTINGRGNFFIVTKSGELEKIITRLRDE